MLPELTLLRQESRESSRRGAPRTFDKRKSVMLVISNVGIGATVE
jgi:hypothetical protein